MQQAWGRGDMFNAKAYYVELGKILDTYNDTCWYTNRNYGNYCDIRNFIYCINDKG